MPPKRRLTAEDDRIAHWVARWAPVTSMQVAQRFGRSRRTAYRRLQVLRDAQLLTLTEPVGSLPGVLYPAPRLSRHGRHPMHGAKLANHLVAVQRVIAYEGDGRALLAAHELHEHPGLLDQLPHHRDRPLRPSVWVLGDPACAIYPAMRGSEEDRRVRAHLASAPQNGLAYELLIEPDTVLEVDLPAHITVLAVDLADVRDASA
ncbi:MAG TPA: hypothetical protein VK501_12850 [Baekduia sp.]|uniref:hypothetical protein n=1 Tax=Baekduia sp. TaxID=2600305 RepID=UPI002CC69F6C|nr:hypothetical protein [Baekduia sp.]HMJ34794.1 hypothetical protein [Baekduia sp.]